MIQSKKHISNLLIIIILQLSINAFSQNEDYFTGAGLSVNFGTKINRIGICFWGGGFRKFVQVNSGLRVFYNISTYGPSLKGFELQAYLGLVLAYGKEKAQPSNFYTSVSNQTLYKNSVAFAYNYYLDQQKTSQPTGLICLEFNNFQVLHENDLFGHSGQDKFRTAAIKLVYTDSLFRFAINSEMWTGDSKHQPRISDSEYPSRAGYIDMSNASYGNFSNGILSFQIDYALPYKQVVRAETGIDSEKVRHILQNRIIHDWIFVPKKVLPPESYNLHIPMLDSNSNQYLFKKEQQVEKGEFFINFSTNAGVFY